MALEANQRHVAVGIEAVHNSVEVVATRAGIDLHVYDTDELNSILKDVRASQDGHRYPKVWPHTGNRGTVAVRLG